LTSQLEENHQLVLWWAILIYTYILGFHIIDIILELLSFRITSWKVQILWLNFIDLPTSIHVHVCGLCIYVEVIINYKSSMRHPVTCYTH